MIHVDSHALGYALAALALAALFAVPLAAIFCMVAAWLYNFFH